MRLFRFICKLNMVLTSDQFCHSSLKFIALVVKQ